MTIASPATCRIPASTTSTPTTGHRRRGLLWTAVPGALGLIALAGCGASATGSATSSSESSTASASSSTASATSSSAPATSGTPSLNSTQLQAISKCLQTAGLPTPTSTDPVQAGAETLTLLRDPRTIAALRACGVDIPGLQGTST
jgi:hypothetical protein